MDKDLKRIEIYCVIAGLEHFLFTTIKGSISFFCLFFLCVNLIESSEPRKVESDEPSVKMVDKKNTHTHTHTHTHIYIYATCSLEIGSNSLQIVFPLL